MNPTEQIVSRRDPAQVMRLSRLGCLHQCRLSFMRTLTRRMAKEQWTFSRPLFEIDDEGVGTAIYTTTGPERQYSLVAFAHDLPAAQRSDRVIAEAWDATFALYDGVPGEAEIARLRNNVPFQEAGRISETELSLSRANRSVRLWNYMVDTLAAGKQPSLDEIFKVGYLMRTTAVYGSGKFGAIDRESIEERAELKAPFQAEMLSVYLTRAFVRDLMQHMAVTKGGDNAAILDPTIAKELGIGNSTGLGMAPFIINHPVLFNNWIFAREEAIARVRSRATASPQELSCFAKLFKQTELLIQRWRSEHPIQIEKLNALKSDIQAINHYVENDDLQADYPWNRLINWSESALSEEGQELLASLILEPYSDLVDDLTDSMADANRTAFVIDGSMSISETMSLIKESYEWALDINWSEEKNSARVWYTSAAKYEPRLGDRFKEPIADFEQPLAPARDATLAYRRLQTWDDETPVAQFLLRHPEHRHTIRRAQQWLIAPYGEIRDNTISDSVLPIDMLRTKLSFFGATHFDPRSDRWVRICMFAGAPYPEDLSNNSADFWIYPQTTK